MMKIRKIYAGQKNKKKANQTQSNKFDCEMTELTSVPADIVMVGCPGGGSTHTQDSRNNARTHPAFSQHPWQSQYDTGVLMISIYT